VGVVDDRGDGSKLVPEELPVPTEEHKSVLVHFSVWDDVVRRVGVVNDDDRHPVDRAAG
jgi:hypothetical protein